MAEDTRNFIEKTQSRSQGYNGRELTADEMATEFMKCDIDARVAALEELAADDRAYTSTREAAKAYEYRKALRDTHERLRKVGR
jgi:hypothetical protein